MLSVVEVFVEYGTLYTFDVCFDLCVGICVMSVV